MCIYISGLILLLALTALDIAMFTINMQRECTLGTEDGMSQYVNFSLSTWMYWTSITHFSVVSFMTFILISAALQVLILFRYGIRVCCAGTTFCVFVMAHVFLLAWTVIGFLLQEEIRNHGVNNEQCNQVLLAWCSIHIVTLCCMPIAGTFLCVYM